MRIAALLLLSAFVLPAQTAKPEERSRVEGHIANAATGEPIGKATVTLIYVGAKPGNDDWLRNYAAVSDAKGNFALADIEAGNYRLRAQRNGFLIAEYGAHGSQATGAVLNLKSPQQMQNVDLRLTPFGVVTGRIVDADGDPVPGAQVQLLLSKYVNGKKMLASESSAVTNDLGEFRAVNLRPGRYYVYFQAFYGAAPLAGSKEKYVPAYYPGSLDSEGAAPIDVAAGAQIQIGNAMLRKAPTVSAKGRVVMEIAGASGLPSVQFSRSIGHNDASVGNYHTGPARVFPSGQFEAHDLTPGTYSVMAQVAKNGMSMVSEILTVNIGAVNVEGLVLTIRDPVTLQGRIRAEGDGALNLKSLRVKERRGGPAGDLNLQFGGYPVAENGTFRLEETQPDIYGVAITNLPDGFYVKSVRAGETDITYSGFDLRNGPPGLIDILLSPKAGAVSAVAQNADTSLPAPGATVVMVPKEKDRAQIPEYYPQAIADQAGRVTFHNVPPGDYAIYAWEDVEPTAWLDPEFIKPFESKGAAIKVDESAKTSVQVSVIPVSEKKPQ